MTQNLRIAGGTTLNSSNSNISSSYIIPATEVYDSGNTTDGCWYNFCTASAGTVCSASDDVDATSDICPSGWRLPNSGETPGRREGDIEKSRSARRRYREVLSRLERVLRRFINR